MSIFKGWLGEKMATFGMWAFIDENYYRRFHDIIVPSSNGTTQIDHLLVSPYGLFVIETKNMDGWIFGSENQAKWTQQFYRKKFSFQNPLRQNFRHIKCLSEYLNVNETHFHSVVFFIGECEFKTDMPSNVLNKGFKAHIESYRIPVLAEPDLSLIIDAIQRLKNDPSLTKANHLKSLDDRHNSSTVCPKCGGKLVERTARRGPNAGSKFLGCSSYPKCKFTR